ncbi:MAG: phosphate ABC transporter substrate-binding protein [Candidatus Dadabacteria bacterium]|nr:phosphate ABC transporter substrate-binding protein [Candidatus Dadabacteria bacterium]
MRVLFDARIYSSLFVIAFAVWMFSAATYADADSRLPSYKKVSGVSGNINSIGSDSMNNLMALWCEGFTRYYPSVRCQIEGKGSSTAPPALIEATAQIGPMSRAMKGTEIDKFEAKFGYKPTRIRTALDALAVFVNKDNPIEGLTIAQMDAIYSKTRKCGGSRNIVTWGQAGLDGGWTKRPISIYGRNSASGTYGYVKKVALCKGDFKDEVKEQPGSGSVVQSVSGDLYGIGYSGIGYMTSGVRSLPLAKRSGAPFVEASARNVLNGTYPLGRFLYIYINKPPSENLSPLVREFVKYILSREGQVTVLKDGYNVLPASIVEKELTKLN